MKVIYDKSKYKNSDRVIRGGGPISCDARPVDLSTYGNSVGFVYFYLGLRIMRKL